MLEQPMRYMTVIKAGGKGVPSTIECIDLREVDFIETINRKVIFHIGTDQYYQITSKSDFDEFLMKEGFDNLDRTNLVNLRKIKKFDEELGKVYFTENPDKDSKYALVARIKYKFISSLLKRIASSNNGTTLEVKTQSEKGWKHILKGLIEHK
ncbi:LytTR family transcriptional regulator DNA-binding domain-containing protein [Priestia abyssalis]|uniref:LytTR family transcriptional regulator DNA-binding domain-containing protein n=1 Tax=Priestia abyssalis TaxID=1221450 RepID=UPI000994A924|nr:LytTR family transcriptional regulator DNA-binding domain-containing protein [Priestia abyssalis]